MDYDILFLTGESCRKIYEECNMYFEFDADNRKWSMGVEE